MRTDTPASAAATSPTLIVADWGTTSCRFAVIAADGTVVDRVAGRGILPVLAEAEQARDARDDRGSPVLAEAERAHDARDTRGSRDAQADATRLDAHRAPPSAQQRAAIFETELRRQVGPWLEQTPRIPVLMCGMIGSNTGWVDAGYREVPCDVVVGPDDLAPVPLQGHEARIVPGLIIRGHAPDIMRGEETQVLGALREAGEAEEHLVIAPGTHSKWVRIRSGTVVGFRSYLTGELFTALREHTIIGRGVPQPELAGGAAGEDAFRAGLERSCGADGSDLAAAPTPGRRNVRSSLLHTVFSARTRVVAGDLEPSGVPAYLSGLLIGDEIADGLAATEVGPQTVVTVIGSADLAERYRTALAHAGITARVAGEDATLAGLLAVAEATGWLDAAPGGTAPREDTTPREHTAPRAHTATRADTAPNDDPPPTDPEDA